MRTNVRIGYFTGVATLRFRDLWCSARVTVVDGVRGYASLGGYGYTGRYPLHLHRSTFMKWRNLTVRRQRKAPVAVRRPGPITHIYLRRGSVLSLRRSSDPHQKAVAVITKSVRISSGTGCRKKPSAPIANRTKDPSITARA